MHKLVVHCQRDEFDVYIGRGSKWGNPYSHLVRSAALYQVETREDAIQCYEQYLLDHPELIEAAQQQLLNKRLACYCSPLACHGEVLVKYANTKICYYAALKSEYQAIEESNHTKFSIPELGKRKNIFYLISDKRYIEELSHDKPKWEEDYYLLRFYLDQEYFDSLNEFKATLYSKNTYDEHWLTVEELEKLNSHIVGTIHSILEIKS